MIIYHFHCSFISSHGRAYLQHGIRALPVKISVVHSLSFSFFLQLHSFVISETTLSNTESFLYLHPSENLAIALVSPILDSTNYHSWSRSMITALSAKNKVEFEDGSTSKPLKTDRTYGAWRRCNNMVISWIFHSVAISIRQSILWMDKAEEI